VWLSLLLLLPAGVPLWECIGLAPLQALFLVIDAATPAERLDHGKLTPPPSDVVTSAVIELGRQRFTALSISA
jgi:hypothetical protein